MLSGMAKSMKIKFDKYWGNMKSTNLLLYIAVVLDPRRKLFYLRFCFKKVMDEVAGNELLCMIHDALTRIYMWFVSNAASSSGHGGHGPSNSSTGGRVVVDQTLDYDSLDAEFKRKMKIETSTEDSKTELEQYLSDGCMLGGDKFDILYWWKVNSYRYPIVSQIAKQIMAVPVSTVASEACFSTGGRVLDVFRSSLSPDHVEGLICTQNWPKGRFKSSRDKATTEEAIGSAKL